MDSSKEAGGIWNCAIERRLREIESWVLGMVVRQSRILLSGTVPT